MPSYLDSSLTSVPASPIGATLKSLVPQLISQFPSEALSGLFIGNWVPSRHISSTNFFSAAFNVILMIWCGTRILFVRRQTHFEILVHA